MTKYLFFVWCLVLSVSSCNAQFNDHSNRPSFEPRYPLLDPQEHQLEFNNLDKKALLNKLKDRLKDNYFNTETPTLPAGRQHNSVGPNMGNFFSAIIQQVLKAVMKYAETLAQLFPSQFRTVTTTEMKTSYFSCTVSTTACAGRRRHRADAIKHLLDETQTAFPLTYSIFGNGPSPDVLNLSSDDEKKPFSDYGNNPSLYGSLSYYDPELLEGSIMDPVTTSLKENGSLNYLINIQQLPPNQAATLLSRLGLNTITTTITNYTSITHTSYPVCSSHGTVSQCPY